MAACRPRQGCDQKTVVQSSLTLTTVHPHPPHARAPARRRWCRRTRARRRRAAPAGAATARSGWLAEIQHLDVAVGVAAGHHRPATDAAPDADRLLRPVVQIVRLGLVRDRAAAFVGGVLERGGAADHPLARDAVDLLADRPHEVAPSAGDDVVGEPVGLQVAEQLDHRGVGAREIVAAERRVAGGVEELVRGRVELLDAHALVGLEDPAGEDAHVRVVAGVVLGHQPAQPGVIALVGGLPRLACAQRRVGLGHRRQPAQDEVALDRHRLLAPERSVVVEDRDALLDGHRGNGVRHEVEDRLPRGAVAPARERWCRRHARTVGRRAAPFVTPRG